MVLQDVIENHMSPSSLKNQWMVFAASLRFSSPNEYRISANRMAERVCAFGVSCVEHGLQRSPRSVMDYFLPRLAKTCCVAKDVQH